VDEMQLILKAIEALGADAKWTLICYFGFNFLGRVGVVGIFCYTVLKVVRLVNENK
jgi:hypothetical protein